MFHIIASQKFIQILTFISQIHSAIHFLFNSTKRIFCCKAVSQAFFDKFSTSFQNTHHKAIIASHSYLFINHLFVIIISDIFSRYSFKKDISFSGENFSLIVVNHSISEKKTDIVLLSHSKLIIHEDDNISSTISFETYSESALLNFNLSLFSIKYLTIFEITTEIKNAKIISKEELGTNCKNISIKKNITIIQKIEILLTIRNFQDLLKFK